MHLQVPALLMLTAPVVYRDEMYMYTNLSTLFALFYCHLCFCNLQETSSIKGKPLAASSVRNSNYSTAH
eukprot:10303-Heterococcus_DN1.PRE.2